MNLKDFPDHVRKRIQTQIQADDSRKSAKLESNPLNAPLATQEVQRPVAQRFRVCIRNKRKRLIDEDNLCEKYTVDLLRYCGAIPDDSPDETKIEVSQSKCKKGEQEEIEIEVMEITTI